MRKRQSRGWTGSIGCFRCRPDAPSGTGLNTIATAPFSLYAAHDVKTGAVHGMTAARHTAQQFIAFLKGLVERARWAKEIHVVLDNLSAHKRFLADHPQVRFHFTPTYSSRLNQVELWFAKIQRDVIARGVFTFSRRSRQQTPQIRSRLLEIS